MSLADAPDHSVATWTPCTCGADRPGSTELRHHERCAKLDPSHPQNQYAAEKTRQLKREWIR
jgi:hypothetical protein